MNAWRAWHTFLTSLAGAFGLSTVFMLASVGLHFGDGLTTAQADILFRGLYWGVYPLVFVALGALGWHFVRSYRGDYAA